MTSLADRIEAATEPSRELDAEVARLALSAPAEFRGGELVFASDHDRWFGLVPDYTTDLKAAMALKDEALPGWLYRIESLPDGSVAVELRPHGSGPDDVVRRVTRSDGDAAMALVEAICRARGV